MKRIGKTMKGFMLVHMHSIKDNTCDVTFKISYGAPPVTFAGYPVLFIYFFIILYIVYYILYFIFYIYLAFLWALILFELTSIRWLHTFMMLGGFIVHPSADNPRHTTIQCIVDTRKFSPLPIISLCFVYILPSSFHRP